MGGRGENTGDGIMSSGPRCTLRTPTAADLYRGGRSLLQLIDGMSEQTLRGFRFEAVDDRADMVMIRADGMETLGWGWTVMDTLGAVVFLRNLNRAPESRRIDAVLGGMEFIIDGRWGILPPSVPALRCACAVFPDPMIRASLRVLTAEEAQAERQHAAQNPGQNPAHRAGKIA